MSSLTKDSEPPANRQKTQQSDYQKSGTPRRRIRGIAQISEAQAHVNFFVILNRIGASLLAVVGASLEAHSMCRRAELWKNSSIVVKSYIDTYSEKKKIVRKLITAVRSFFT